jgi:hypothetical protein
LIKNWLCDILKLNKYLKINKKSIFYYCRDMSDFVIVVSQLQFF